MKEIPILFSTPMVQAILDGRKTMTRRVIKPQPILDEESGHVFTGHTPAKRSPFDIHNWKDPFADQFCPYGQPGDILWVREKWRKYYHVDEYGYTHFDKQIFEFAADNPPMILEKDGDGCQVFNKDGTEKFISWKPSIHMPKSACRIWLMVTNVRVERLNDISEYDAKSEGVAPCFDVDSHYHNPDDYKNYTWHGEGGDDSFSGYSNTKNAKDSFQSLWYKINGKDSWESNQWVWVVSFKVLSTTGLPDFKPPVLIASPGEGAVIVEGVKDVPKTIGQLLTEAMRLHELKVEVVEKKLRLGSGNLLKLMNDDFYTNSIPIMLFKNLILSLHIKPENVFEAMMPTFRLILSKETPETIKKKPHGYRLWECEEAIEKYTARLKELIVEGISSSTDYYNIFPTIHPECGFGKLTPPEKDNVYQSKEAMENTQKLWDDLRKSEIN